MAWTFRFHDFLRPRLLVAVVDASVWVSLCHAGDRFHERCSRWLEKALVDGSPLAAPTLLRIEVAAAICRLTGSQKLAAAATATIAESKVFELKPLTDERSLQAAEIACKVAVRGADAVYLQLAAERGDVLVTLDRQQLQRGSGVARVERP